jgi:hypothetical protein
MSITDKVKSLQTIVDSQFVKTLCLMEHEDVLELVNEHSFNNEFKQAILAMDAAIHAVLWSRGTYDALTISHFNQIQSDKNIKLAMRNVSVTDAFMERNREKLNSAPSHVARWQIILESEFNNVVLMDRTVAIILKGEKNGKR